MADRIRTGLSSPAPGERLPRRERPKIARPPENPNRWRFTCPHCGWRSADVAMRETAVNAAARHSCEDGEVHMGATEDDPDPGPLDFGTIPEE